MPEGAEEGCCLSGVAEDEKGATASPASARTRMEYSERLLFSDWRGEGVDKRAGERKEEELRCVRRMGASHLWDNGGSSNDVSTEAYTRAEDLRGSSEMEGTQGVSTSGREAGIGQRACHGVGRPVHIQRG